MDKLVDKIDSYNIFNYFVPGAIILEFLMMLGAFAGVTDVLTRLVLYYFAGLTVSRIGSIILEPALKRIGAVVHSDYDLYVKACTKDKKIELFVEIANMYRTLYVGAFVCLVAAFVLNTPAVVSNHIWLVRASLASLVLLFFLSYRKQSHYINRRVSIQSSN